MIPTKRPERPTPRQLQALLFIQSFRDRHCFPPTVRDIGKGLGIASENGVHGHLSALRHKGWLSWVPRSSRSLVLLYRLEALCEVDGGGVRETGRYLVSRGGKAVYEV